MKSFAESIVALGEYWQWFFFFFFFFLVFIYFYLAALGLSCGMQDLRSSLWHENS